MFLPLTVVDHAAVNVGAPICWSPHFQFFMCVPRSGIAGSYGNSAFNFSGSCHPVSRSDRTILRSHQGCTRCLVSPHPHQCLFLFFDNSHPSGVCLIVHLMGMPLLASDVEYLFTYLIGHSCIFLEEMCVQTPRPGLTGAIFVAGLWSCAGRFLERACRGFLASLSR